MRWIKTIGSEFFGLFVDDVRFAVTIMLWLLMNGFVVSHLGLPSPLPPLILFAGLAVILMESAMRGARGKR
jgi:hypothetical protein